MQVHTNQPSGWFFNLTQGIHYENFYKGAYLSHEEACAFMLLPDLETKMTYIKAISNEQKGI